MQFAIVGLILFFAWAIMLSSSPTKQNIIDEALFLSVWDPSLKDNENWSNYVWQGTLIYCLLYRLMLDFIYKYIKSKAARRKEKMKSASQYTIMVTNVPETLRIRDEEKFAYEIFQQRYPYVKINSYTFGYDVEQLSNMSRTFMYHTADINRIKMREELRFADPEAGCICWLSIIVDDMI